MGGRFIFTIWYLRDMQCMPKNATVKQPPQQQPMKMKLLKCSLTDTHTFTNRRDEYRKFPHL